MTKCPGHPIGSRSHPPDHPLSPCRAAAASRQQRASVLGCRLLGRGQLRASRLTLQIVDTETHSRNSHSSAALIDRPRQSWQTTHHSNTDEPPTANPTDTPPPRDYLYLGTQQRQSTPPAARRPSATATRRLDDSIDQGQRLAPRHSASNPNHRPYSESDRTITSP